MGGQVRPASNRKIVYCQDIPALRDQRVDEMAADESSAACYDIEAPH
jgi:hypothetical protein